MLLKRMTKIVKTTLLLVNNLRNILMKNIPKNNILKKVITFQINLNKKS